MDLGIPPLVTILTTHSLLSGLPAVPARIHRPHVPQSPITASPSGSKVGPTLAVRCTLGSLMTYETSLACSLRASRAECRCGPPLPA